MLPWDAAVLGTGVMAWWMLVIKGVPHADMLLIVIGHFFLFCNVFRLRQSYELVWAGVLVINVYSALQGGWISTSWILTAQLPVTAVFIILEMTSSEYHGIFCRRINPSGVEKWLQGDDAA